MTKNENQNIESDFGALPDAQAELDKIAETTAVEDAEAVERIKSETGVVAQLDILNQEAMTEKENALREVAEVLKKEETTNEVQRQRLENLRKIYNSNPELAAIGSEKQYEEYLESVLPLKLVDRLGTEYVQTKLDDFLNSGAPTGWEDVEKRFYENFFTLASEADFDKTEPYKEAQYNVINNALRAGGEMTFENLISEDEKPHRHLQSTIDIVQERVDACEAMMKVIEKSSWLPNQSVFSNQKTYRVNLSNYLHDREVGDIIQDKGFLSTSLDSKPYAKPQFEGDRDTTIIIFDFPKNTVLNCAALEGLEKEVVFAPNTPYRMKNKRVIMSNGAKKTVFQAEMMPNKYMRVLGSEDDKKDFARFVENGKKTEVA